MILIKNIGFVSWNKHKNLGKKPNVDKEQTHLFCTA